MKHYLATLLILLAAAGGHLHIARAQDQAARKQIPQRTLDIPKAIGPYVQQGADYEVSERTRRVLATSGILIRNYATSGGRQIQLTIVYAGATRRSLHFPEVCLVGDGWEVREQETMPVGFSFTAKRLVLVKGNQKEAVLYWFKTGDRLTGNFFVNTWHWVRTQFLAGAATSAMIKVSARIGNEEEKAVFAALEGFAAMVTPILMERIE